MGGTVQGLDAGETVELSLNLSEVVSVNADGPFTFATPVAFQAAYDVGLAAVPTDKECTIENGTGVMGAADVANVLVTCAPRPCEGVECIEPKLAMGGRHGVLPRRDRVGAVLGSGHQHLQLCGRGAARRGVERHLDEGRATLPARARRASVLPGHLGHR